MLLQITDPTDYHTDEKDQNTRAIGIDLGTTNSVVAYVDNGQPRTLLLKHGALTPSVVRITDTHISVGEDTASQDHSLENPTHTSSSKEIIFRSTKRLFHTPDHSLFNTKETPISVATHILKYLKEEAEKNLGGDSITKAVITVPAYFDEPARQATKRAAELAGFDVLRLIAEPTAAALAYGLEKKVEGIYAIFDLGGGTFDFSLLRLQGEVFQVLATGGDTLLGGDDIDRAICQHCKFHNPLDARILKESLSTHPTAVHHNVTLSTEELAMLSQPFIDRALEVCAQVLRDAEVTPQDIEGIVLVGGSTRLRCLQKAVADFFGKEPLTDINPDEVVAHGAALQAHALTHPHHEDGLASLLLDVTPLSLGIETMGGLVEVIIPRNTPLPCHMAQDFTTSIDGQKNLSIHIIQGEREFVKDCRSLGQFILSDIPSMPAYTPRLRVTFQLDVDGLLTVSALEQSSGTRQSLEIKPIVGLDESKLHDMIRDGVTHSMQDMEERLLAKAQGEAEHLLSELQKTLEALDETIGDYPAIQNAAKVVQEAIDVTSTSSSDHRHILKEACETLAHLCHPLAEKRIKRALKDEIS